MKVRQNGRIVSVAVIIAVGVNGVGRERTRPLNVCQRSLSTRKMLE